MNYKFILCWHTIEIFRELILHHICAIGIWTLSYAYTKSFYMHFLQKNSKNFKVYQNHLIIEMIG